MVRGGPVEPGALGDQDLLLQQQVQHQLLVVDDVVHLRVEAGERVQRALGFHARHPGDLVELLPRHITLLEQPTTRQHQVLDALMAAERHLNGVLRGHIRAQPHVGQQADALDEAGGVLLGAGDDEPTRPVTGHAVGLGQPVERQRQHVGGHRRHRDVLGVVVEDLVVDLVGQQHQFVLAGQVGDLVEHLAAVHRPGRVVRVDHDDRLGAVGDLGLQIRDVGLPALRLVAQVVHRGAAGQGRRRRPQRVVRRRDQHLVAVVQQCLQRHRDQLGDTVAEVDVVDVEAGEPVDEFIAGEHRAAGADDALGVRIALRIGQSLDDVAHDHIGRLEPERRRVADVQLQDAVPLGLQPGGVLVHRAADLVENVLQLARLREHTLARVMAAARLPRRRMGSHVDNSPTVVDVFLPVAHTSASGRTPTGWCTRPRRAGTPAG